MTTIFTKIIAGEIPGRFIWADELCVAISTIEPINPGHVLVIPRQEVSSYWEAPPETVAHMSKVCQILCQAQLTAFDAARSGLIVAGFDVPHLHIHVVPLHSQKELTLAKACPEENSKLDEAAIKLRETLINMGQSEHVPPNINSL